MKTKCEMCGDKSYKELETPDGEITMCKGCYESYVGFCDGGDKK